MPTDSVFPAYQSINYSLAKAAQRDPSLFANHFTHGVPTSLRRMQREAVELLDLLNGPDPRYQDDDCRKAYLDELEQIKEALAIYDDAKARGLDYYLCTDLELNGRTVRVHVHGRDQDGHPLHLFTYNERGFRSNDDSPELRALLAKRLPPIAAKI